MNRRQMLSLCAGAVPVVAGISCSSWAIAAEPKQSKNPLGVVIHSYGIRGSRPMPPEFTRIDDPLSFVEHCAGLGAAGVQIRIGQRDDAYLAQLREKVARHGMYLEGMIALPKEDADLPRFESELRTSKSAGVTTLRTACLGDRRYERFDTLESFRQFAAQAWASLQLAEPLLKNHKMRLAIENHKDWRIDELLDLLRRLSSEHIGVCIDTGNSISLLEDPLLVVEAYAPFAFTTHFKDMGVAEYDDGFLLSEVPLGQGFLDLPRIAATLRRARPEVRLNLEMITRDPLRIPCLTPRYWATLDRVSGRDLADTLARVRKHKFAGPLPTVGQLDAVERLHTEEANVRRSLRFAQEKLTML